MIELWRLDEDGHAPESYIRADSAGGPSESEMLVFTPDADAGVGIVSTSLTRALPVSTDAPVGARYAWRVESVLRPDCTSEFRYFNIGRAQYDFDGEGRSDMAIGSPKSTSRNDGTGAAQTLNGHVSEYRQIRAVVGRNNFSHPAAIFEPGAGSGSFDEFGSNLAVGDLDGDGFADLVVRNPFDDRATGGGRSRGSFNIYLGSSSGLVFAHRILSKVGDGGGSDYVRFAKDISIVDINHDGLGDIAFTVENILYDGSRMLSDFEQRVYILDGRTRALLAPGTLEMDTGWPHVREEITVSAFDNRDAVAQMGDRNGDALPDLIFAGHYIEVSLSETAPSNSFAPMSSSWLEAEPANTIAIEEGQTAFRHKRDCRYDLDGDLVADCVFGRPNAAEGDGYVAIDYGARGDFRIISAPAPDRGFGRRVSVIGDVDGDGVLDAYASNGEKVPSGMEFAQRYLVFRVTLGESPTTARVLTRYGRPVDGLLDAGDLDGDGYPDLVVAADFEGEDIPEFEQDSNVLAYYGGGPTSEAHGLREFTRMLADGTEFSINDSTQFEPVPSSGTVPTAGAQGFDFRRLPFRHH